MVKNDKYKNKNNTDSNLNLKLLESVVTEANDAVLITKAEPVKAPKGPEIIYVNKSFEKMTGYKSEEVIGKTPRILQGPYTESAELQKLRTAIIKQKPADVEVLNYTKNGKEFWVNISLSPIFENEKCTHFVSVQRDVTERKLRYIKKTLTTEISLSFNNKRTVQEAMKASLSELIKLKHFNAIEFWLVNREKKQINLAAFEVNELKTTDFYAVSNKIVAFNKGEGLPGKTWEKKESLFWRNLDKRKTFKRRDEAAVAGLKTAISLPVIDNQEVLGVLILLLNDDLKRERYFLDLFKSLSSQFASEIKRKMLEEEFTRVFNSAPDGIIVAGFDGYLKKVNPAFCEILGYSEKELLSRPFIDFVYPNDRERTIEEYEKANMGEGKSYFENRYIKKSGKLVWLAWTYKLFKDERIAYSVAKDVTEEIQMKQRLDQSNRLAKIGSWEVDLIKREIYWSKITREIYEVNAEYKPDLDSAINFYKEGACRDKIRKAVNHTIEKGEGWDLELQVVTAKGNERWVRTIGEAEMADDKCIRIYGSFQDINFRKITEVQLEEKNRHINAIASLSAALLNYEQWFKALESNLKLIGEAVHADRAYYFENRYDEETGEGFSTQKLEWCRDGFKSQTGNPDLEEIPFTEVPELVDPMIRGRPSMALLNEVDKNTVTRHIMEDLDIKTFLAIPVMVKGKFHGFVGFDSCKAEVEWSEEDIRTLKTITSNLEIAIERNKTNTEREELLEEKNTILESIGDGFYALNHDWVVTYWNNKAEDLLGMPKDAILGRKLWDLYEDAVPLEFYSQYHKAVRDQVNVQFEEYYPRLEKWFDVSAYPSPLGLSVYFKDITGRKIANEQLKQLNKNLEDKTMALEVSNAELEQFAFVASHDLQEPLRMISSFMALLQRKYGDKLDDRAHKYIHFATDGAKRMRQIILDLLEYSRVGKLDAKRQEIDVNRLLVGVKKLHKILIHEKDAIVIWDSMPIIRASEGPMRQIFQNLLHNALYYQKKDNKPIVKIWSKELKSHWKFFVQDNGIGIDEEYKDKIFNIFQRLNIRDEFSGTGVGLAVCKKIVEEHGGEIGVESEKDKGSTFYFTIPKQN